MIEQFNIGETNMYAIILAAGTSSRMKQAKLLLKWKTGTLLSHMIDTVLDANITPIIVTGCYKNRIEEEINKIETKRKISLIKIHNEDYELGQLSSLVCGVKKLVEIDKEKEAFFVTVTDLPLIKPQDFLTLIPHLKSHDALRPKVEETFGHPVLLKNELKNEIVLLDYKNKREGLRSFLKQKDTVAFPSSNKAYITDIDTPSNYNVLIDNI